MPVEKSLLPSADRWTDFHHQNDEDYPQKGNRLPSSEWQQTILIRMVKHYPHQNGKRLPSSEWWNTTLIRIGERLYPHLNWWNTIPSSEWWKTIPSSELVKDYTLIWIGERLYPHQNWWKTTLIRIGERLYPHQNCERLYPHQNGVRLPSSEWCKTTLNRILFTFKHF